MEAPSSFFRIGLPTVFSCFARRSAIAKKSSCTPLWATGETSGTNQWVNETTFVLESAASLQALIPATRAEGEKVLPPRRVGVFFDVFRADLSLAKIRLDGDFLIFDVELSRRERRERRTKILIFLFRTGSVSRPPESRSREKNYERNFQPGTRDI